MKAYDIEWDTDGENIDLPTEIEIPDGMTDEDDISDYLSEFTGFCHKGFRLCEDSSETGQPEMVQNHTCKSL